MSSIANLDFGRYERRGYPEAVLCDGKSLDQCVHIARTWRAKANEGLNLGTVLFTRITEDKAKAVTKILDGAIWHETARMVAWPGDVPEPSGGKVIVACAGTSDLPVAQEAALTARYLGRSVTELVDVGVAGLDRILAHRETLQSARVIVVVAGMEGALAPSFQDSFLARLLPSQPRLATERRWEASLPSQHAELLLPRRVRRQYRQRLRRRTSRSADRRTPGRHAWHRMITATADIPTAITPTLMVILMTGLLTEVTCTVAIRCRRLGSQLRIAAHEPAPTP